MTRRRRHPRPVDHQSSHPRYEWALNAAGEPVPIAQAAHGQAYSCPLCQGRMTPRLGGQKQHHFAHEVQTHCDPLEVARATAGRWLTQALRGCLTARAAIQLSWPCPICCQTHSADLLAGIGSVEQNYGHDDLRSDVALLDATGAVRAAIAVSLPDRETVLAYARRGTTLIAIDPATVRARLRDLPTLLGGAAIHGGVCTTQLAAAQRGIVADVAALRDLLARAADAPPFYMYGVLETDGDLTHILTLGTRRLWLPPLLWERAVGGLHHKINPALQIVSQEWPQPGGATIALYYVTVRDTCAVAVRRFAPGAPVYARLSDTTFRSSQRLTALNVARSFAEL